MMREFSFFEIWDTIYKVGKPPRDPYNYFETQLSFEFKRTLDGSFLEDAKNGKFMYKFTQKLHCENAYCEGEYTLTDESIKKKDVQSMIQFRKIYPFNTQYDIASFTLSFFHHMSDILSKITPQEITLRSSSKRRVPNTFYYKDGPGPFIDFEQKPEQNTVMTNSHIFSLDSSKVSLQEMRESELMVSCMAKSEHLEEDEGNIYYAVVLCDYDIGKSKPGSGPLSIVSEYPLVKQNLARTLL